MDWNNFANNTVADYKLIADFDVEETYEVDYLDVSETIFELSYLTHDYFRYYGKFPSKIAKYIIDTLKDCHAISTIQDFIFDNYNGSGTSLVEAKIAGFSSSGIDINPFGVLASNVKTRNYDVSRLLAISEELFAQIEQNTLFTYQKSLFSSTDAVSDIDGVSEMYRRIHIDFPDVEKWFTEETIYQLAIIKHYILLMPHDIYREFFSLGFFAIIRRVSKAYDAEVRPHINPKKKTRNAIEAFKKKILEMISTMRSWNAVTSSTVFATAYICDNSNSQHVKAIVANLKSQFKKEMGLVISHPPYLNCFDYIPVYRLKFLWAFGFDEIYGSLNYRHIKDVEIKSYPASTDKLINNYFQHNMNAYKIVFDCLRSGGFCCVVIGDCTIQKELFPVHKMVIKEMESIGFRVKNITYRSTSYGLGRYAYRHKADYNEKEDGKRDAVIFFQKP